MNLPLDAIEHAGNRSFVSPWVQHPWGSAAKLDLSTKLTTEAVAAAPA